MESYRAGAVPTDDMAGRQYWDSTYAKPSQAVFNPHVPGVRSFWKRRLHQFFLDHLSQQRPEKTSLLEIGCGDSRMLGYFAREFGFKVTGIDYSQDGCDQAKANLAGERMEGTVVCADLFTKPTSLLEQFDVAVSFGVVEHFADTAKCLFAISDFVRPDGLIVTSVPNMSGLVGMLQGWLDNGILKKHLRLNAELLRLAHERADLCVLSCEYLLFVNLGVVNINETVRGTFEYSVKALVLKLLQCITGAVWAFEQVFGSLKPNRFTSPYIVCVARKNRQCIN